MRWYHKLLLGVCILGMFFLIVFFGFKIEHIKVEGTECYTSDEIVDSVFTRKFSDNELVFMIYQKLYGLNKLPFVEDIEVTYNNRNTVTLHVYDKTISGCIKYMGQYVYFDKDGIVLQSLIEKKEGVPIVTGIKFGKFTVGQPFSVEDESLFTTIMNLSGLIGHYKIEVKKIHLAADKIIIYSGNIKVLLRNKAMYDDEVAALSSILDTAKKEGLSGVIDMRAFEKGSRVSLQQEKKEKKQKKTGKDEKNEASSKKENSQKDDSQKEETSGEENTEGEDTEKTSGEENTEEEDEEKEEDDRREGEENEEEKSDEDENQKENEVER